MRKLKNLFTESEVICLNSLKSIEGGAIFFDSSKGLYINGMLVDAWTFKLALMGFDVAQPDEDDGNDHTEDVTVISHNNIETNY